MTDEEFEDLWESLSDNQKKVAEEYIWAKSKAEAARKFGLTPSAVYSWDDHVWEAASALIDQRKDGIMNRIASLSDEALSVLRQSLQDEDQDDRVQSEDARYIINHLQGKPTQKQEVEHSGGIDLDSDDMEAVDKMVENINSDS